MTDSVDQYSNNQYLIFESKSAAEIAKKEMQKKLHDHLHPKIEYKTIRTGWFRKETIRMPSPKLPEWHVEVVKQKLNTMFVESTKIV